MLSNLITHRTLPLIVGIPVVALVVIVGLTLKPATKAATETTPTPTIPASSTNSDSGFHLHHTDAQLRDRKLQLRGQIGN
jgi:hypothetical protein